MELDELKFKTPFSCLISGPSGCGKSTLVWDMLCNKEEIFDRSPSSVIICYAHMQPIYRTIQAKLDIPVSLVQGIDDSLRCEKNSLVIVDDLQGTNSAEVCEFFTRKSHHYDCSICYLVQNIFGKESSFRTISLNAGYIGM